MARDDEGEKKGKIRTAGNEDERRDGEGEVEASGLRRGDGRGGDNENRKKGKNWTEERRRWRRRVWLGTTRVRRKGREGKNWTEVMLGTTRVIRK